MDKSELYVSDSSYTGAQREATIAAVESQILWTAREDLRDQETGLASITSAEEFLIVVLGETESESKGKGRVIPLCVEATKMLRRCLH